MKKLILVFIVLASTTGCCKLTDPNCMAKEKGRLNGYCKSYGYEKGSVLGRDEIYCLNKGERTKIDYNFMTGLPGPYADTKDITLNNLNKENYLSILPSLDEHCRENGYVDGFIVRALKSDEYWCVKADKSMVRTAFRP